MYPVHASNARYRACESATPAKMYSAGSLPSSSTTTSDTLHEYSGNARQSSGFPEESLWSAQDDRALWDALRPESAAHEPVGTQPRLYADFSALQLRHDQIESENIALRSHYAALQRHAAKLEQTNANLAATIDLLQREKQVHTTVTAELLLKLADKSRNTARR